MIKKFFLQILSLSALIIASNAVNVCSWCTYYQPEFPKDMADN